MPSIGRIQVLHATSVQPQEWKMGMENQCSHTYLLFVWGFYDDASLRRLHRNTEDIFGVGKVADSPLKAGLCVFTHEHRLWKQKHSDSFYRDDITGVFSKRNHGELKQTKMHIRKWRGSTAFLKQ